MSDDYDIVFAFEAIEDELIASMIRNLRRHKNDEIKEDKQWSMWQTEQLKSLEKYRRSNEKRFGTEFSKINAQIEGLILAAKDEGEMEQELQILRAIKNGFKAKKVSAGATAEFFKLNERKLEALIKATTDDMQKAETAVLRMANDQYRKIIYNAQVYANTGSGTYESAVDMATKDFLSAGLNCVEYANGARHTLSEYARMAIRTASKRAYLQGEGQKRKEWGVSTVIVNKRGNPCPKCLPFCGKIMIDDVWSGGSRKDGPYPLMSDAVAAGLYHPNCKDSHTTYFEGISKEPEDEYTKEEIKQIEEDYKKEQKSQYASRQAKKYRRLEENSIDKANQEKYARKVAEWSNYEIDESEKGAKYLGNTVENDNGSDIIKEKELQRKTGNSGSFAHLNEKMSKKHIRELAQQYEIDMTGIKLTIDKNEELLKLPFAGRADYENVGGITFFPNAFKNKEELVRTLFHERQHILQYKEYGVEYVQENRSRFEKLAYEAEEEFIKKIKKEGRL